MKPNIALLTGLGITALIALTAANWTTTPIGGRRTATVTEPAPSLELLSSRAYQSSTAYWRVTGQIRNAGTDPIDRLAVMTTWYDKAGGFIVTDEAMVTFSPLLPGQVSPWETMTRTNPALATYSIAVRRGSVAIPMADKRGK